ncbi:hypothetical protein FDUTEX481_02307 [Tolypothrix sp. PCC 7601]|nr:hypothetical protein FDUTEX481_02307 [Tolypothrix sp. PCC 7601]
MSRSFTDSTPSDLCVVIIGIITTYEFCHLGNHKIFSLQAFIAA